MDWQVRYIDYPAHYGAIRHEVLKAIDDSLSRGDVILRQDVQEFERAIASMVGAKYAVGRGEECRNLAKLHPAR